MDKEKVFELAKKIVENGKLKSHTYFKEGDVETGPYSVEYKFIQWNGLRLVYHHTSGFLTIESKKIDEYGMYPKFNKTVYGGRYAGHSKKLEKWVREEVYKIFWYGEVTNSK